MQTTRRDEATGPATERTTMRAIVQEHYGAEPEGLLRFTEVERPAPGVRLPIPRRIALTASD